MRRFYSLLLTAAFLLVGMNAWAADESDYDIKVVNHSTSATNYFLAQEEGSSVNILQKAVDCIGAGQSGTITVAADIALPNPVVIPSKASLGNSGKVLTVDPQDITLDLGEGNTITGGTYLATVDKVDNVTCGYGCIHMLKGKLNIIGAGTIQRAAYQGTSNPTRNTITLWGAPWAKKTDGVWTELTIGQNVTVSSNTPVEGDNQKGNTQNKVYGIGFQVSDAAPYGYSNEFTAAGKVGYVTNIADQASAPSDKGSAKGSDGKWDSGCAFGVKAIIKGKVFGHYRGINVQGNINAQPASDIAIADGTHAITKRNLDVYPFFKDSTSNKTPHYFPYCKIESTAEVWSIDDGVENDNNGAIYGGGWLVCDINGYAHGQTGIFARSGDYELKDATVESTSANGLDNGDYHKGTVSGTAVFVASTAGYAGGTNVLIGGDSKVTGNGGSAINEVLTTGVSSSNVSAITIEGGSFSTNSTTNPAIDLTVSGATVTKVEGGNITGQVEVGGQTTTVATLVPQGSHTTVVEVGGKQTVVVSQGAAPAPVSTWDDAMTAYEAWQGEGRPSFKISAAFDKELTADLDLAELELNETTNIQKITVPDGMTLKAGRIVLGTKAQIIVEAGGKFIVSGAQGIVAPVIANIVLQNEENKPALFLFNPAVTSNKHPNGTVEFLSKGFNNTATSTFGWQKFGVPTQTGELTEIIIDGNVPTAFGKFNYEAATPAWEIIGYLNHTPALDLEDLNQSFEYYQMEHNTATVGTKVTFKGKLVGNDCPSPVIRAHFWNGYANSYSAPINGSALLAQIPAPADKAFYLYEWDVLSQKFAWVAKSNLSIKDIQPMQPFLLRNAQDEATALALNYAAAVYNPAVTPSNAPARHATDNMTKVEFVVRGENGVDHVIVAQDAQFSAEFDNGYDVAKYMNDDVNMYVSSNEKMAIFATDNLENTYVGIQTVNGGKYTIEFAEVQGEELMLIDHEANAQVAMVAGGKYEFTAAANSVNDYRFEIVGAAKMPTALENTAVKANAKGIFTITGQYVGEKSMWNSLPAGVYVIDGAKCVK